MDRLSSSVVQTASHLGEHIVRVGSDKTYGSNNWNKNDSQHDCVFCNVLTLVIEPERAKKRPHETLTAGPVRLCL